MRIAKAIAVMLFGPLLGVIAGFFVGGITVEIINALQGPNIVVNPQHATPGDGILIMLFVLVGLLVSIPLSIVLAVRVWARSSSNVQSTSN
jgi:hypothetical protein